LREEQTAPKVHWKKNFMILWSGQAVSILTSSILQMALIWHLTAKTGSALVLSMASIAGFLPNAILGIAAGTLVDRVSRKTAMIGADLFIAGISLLLVLASWKGEVSIALILIVLAVRSVGTAFHTPAISAATPLLVPVEELTKCSGYTQSLQTIGYIAGTALAGILYPICSMSTMVAFDVVGALTASLAVFLIPIPKLEKKEKAKTPLLKGLWQETKEGYQAFQREKGLLALLWSAAVFMILYSPINALFPLMSLEYFHGTTMHASVAEIAFAIGMLAGGMLLGMSGGWKSRGVGIPFSVVMMGVPIALSGLLPDTLFWGFACCCVVMGISVPFYSGPVMALMQERIAPEYLGRVFGLYGSVSSLAMPIGLALSGAFADKVGTNHWFFFTGAGCTVLAVIMYMIPAIRNIDKKMEES
jgi:DHA3 family macrolide efflux protein-like MFS transporter